MSEGIYTVYVIRDPETEEARYVGITKHTLEARAKGHVSAAKNPKTALHVWMKENDSAFIIEALEIGSSTTGAVAERKTREDFWIEKLRAAGFRLFNSLQTKKPISFQVREDPIGDAIMDEIDTIEVESTQ